MFADRADPASPRALIVLLSGIGPTAHSQSLGIPTLLDSPDVGQNMMDHPLLTTNFRVSSNDTLDNLSLNATFAAEQLALWTDKGEGDFTLGACNQWAWQRLAVNDTAIEEGGDPSAGERSPHYQLIFSVSVRCGACVGGEGERMANMDGRICTSRSAAVRSRAATS